jgi:hypothetical protein
MDRLQQWINELRRRQDNIDPIRRIPNGALFQGTLINGNLRLNAVQRIGALLLGVPSLGAGCFGVAHIIASLWQRNTPDMWLPEVIYFPLALWFGWKMTVNAIVNDPKKAHTKK